MRAWRKLVVSGWWLSRLGISLWLLSVLSLWGPVRADSPQPLVEAQATSPRRVNIPYFSGPVNRSQMAIFWFGKNENPPDQGRPQIPGRNYVDVRVGYSPTGLSIWATIVDYYIWYGDGSDPAGDDSIAIYLDPSNDRASSPKTDDYYFILGANHWGNPGAFRHQARGTGSGWGPMTASVFSDTSVIQWNGAGPNNNSNGYEYGWIAGLEIPWARLGLTGPPADDTVWGVGVVAYDRDDASSASRTGPEIWPESMAPANPSTWGELHFGLADYQAPSAMRQGMTTIRAATPTDNTVEDAWAGGNGACSAGQNGGSEVNHGDDTNLFVGSELWPTHFPCFNKTFLRFSLAGVPVGKVIMSATLSLQYTGTDGWQEAPNDEDRGHDSYIWAYTLVDPWQELSIHWNNAPLAQENIDRVVVPPLVVDSIPWLNKPRYQWNVTQAVAQAYADGQSVSVALYDSADARNTTKHFTASETGLGDGTPNWNLEGRPRLDVVWGDSPAAITKRVSNPAPLHGAPITYTLSFLGIGQTLRLTDTLPTGLSAPGSLSATFGGAPSYTSGTRQLAWSAAPAAGLAVTVTYVVMPTITGPGVLQNTARLGSALGETSATAIICVDGKQVFLPLIKR